MGKASELLKVAAAEIGYLEKTSNSNLDSKTANAGSNNYTKYGAWYGLNGPEAYWCHMFVSWCAWQSGNGGIIPKTASCYNGRDWFFERSRFHLRSAYTPKPGDIVYFSTGQYPSGGGHVGIVEKVQGGRVYTIEGNTSGASGVVSNGGGVARKSYPLDYSSIYGYGNPKYETEDDDMITQEQFNQMMETYLTSREQQQPDPWSQEHRDWAEGAGLIVGDENGDKQYKAFCTREQLVTFMHRLYEMVK